MSAYTKKQRRAMWLKDPRCRKCGVVTILPEDILGVIINGIKKMKNIPDNMATIQHFNSRLHPDRAVPARGERRRDLWCAKCNFEDGKAEQQLLPIEDLHERSAILRL